MDIEATIRGLNYSLENALDEEIIKNYEINYFSPINDFFKEEINLLKLNSSIITFYEFSNGVNMRWILNLEKGIIGQLSFLKIEDILKDWSGKLFYKNDLEENDLLEYFKPFDYVTPEVSSGILITPNFTSESIYCHISGGTDLFDLDLDFNGYIEMAKEAKIYNLWTIVLLQIQTGKESTESISFKENMPKIFPEFKWDDFVKKYESLRLSKRGK